MVEFLQRKLVKYQLGDFGCEEGSFQSGHVSVGVAKQEDRTWPRIDHRGDTVGLLLQTVVSAITAGSVATAVHGANGEA